MTQENPVAIVQDPRWTPGPVWTCTENLLSPEFDPRAVRPLDSSHTDYAIPAQFT
jgi:hypothetical protein